MKRKKEETTTEATADIFKYKDKKGYSGLSYKKVLESLGIKSKELFSKDEDIPMKDIDPEVIRDISKNLIKITKACGIVSERNEDKRKRFIDAIILDIVSNYYNEEVEFLAEETIEDEEVK
ncbi:unnamed protein product [Cunninghamella blakesleeana]